MISKSWLKLIKSLQIKKFRVKEGLFLIEGAKSVLELITSDFKIKAIFCTDSFAKEHSFKFKKHSNAINITTEEALASAGTFSTNNAAIAVAEIKEEKKLLLEGNEYALMLDQVSDPGNLGTIIRIADWYGIKKLVCSENCVDFYNPKVITATMGSFLRVEVFYTELLGYIKENKYKEKLFGAFMDGENVHGFTFPAAGFIVMGNESSGISPELEAVITKKVTIPSFGNAESLNVAIATAVILDNLRRR